MSVGPINYLPQMQTFEPVEPYVEKPVAEVASKGFFESAVDQFFGFFRWLGDWIESGFSSSVETPTAYELTPEQKTRIQELYLQSLAVLKDLEHPDRKEEVMQFRKLLLEFYRNRSKILKEEAECHYHSYEYSRKQVQEFQEKERAEFDKMLEDAKAQNFWQTLTEAVTPIFVGIAALGLPAELAVAVVCVSIILTIEALSDHALTKTIAEMAAPDDRQQQALLESRLQMATSILSFALAIPVGYASSGLESLAIVFGVAKTASEVGKTCSEMSMNDRKALITEMKNKSEKYGRKLNEQLGRMQRVQKDLEQSTRLTNHMLDAQNKISPFKQRGG